MPNDPTAHMSDDDIAATLGLITTLGEQHMTQQQEAESAEPAAEPATPEQPEEAEDTKDTERLDKMEQDMAALRIEIGQMIQKEVGSVKDMIKEALSSEDE